MAKRNSPVTRRRSKSKWHLTIRPNEDFQLVNIRASRLSKTRTYGARYASNQPDWEQKGKIFVKEILLERGEYTIVKTITPIALYKQHIR